MNIAVIATAFSGHGTLTIYMQFLNALSKANDDNEYHLFVADWMPQPNMKNVQYHVCTKRKGMYRFWFDLMGFKKISRRLGYMWDAVVSLQNVPVVYSKKARNIVYFHQALTLYDYPIKISDSFAKTYFLYHFIYALYIKVMLKYADYVAVQTSTIKKLFSTKNNFPEEKIGIFFPDLEDFSQIKDISSKLEEGYYNFIYPGTANTYKEHLTLVNAVEKIKTLRPDIYAKLRIHFTILEVDNKELSRAIRTKGVRECFRFHGNMPHKELLSMYIGCNALLFPSMIETIGLPLIEAAAVGLPVVVNDIDFARDVLNGYEGAHFVDIHNYEQWVRCIINFATNNTKYKKFKKDNNNSWGRFLNLIINGESFQTEEDGMKC